MLSCMEVNGQQMDKEMNMYVNLQNIIKIRSIGQIQRKILLRVEMKMIKKPLNTIQSLSKCSKGSKLDKILMLQRNMIEVCHTFRIHNQIAFQLLSQVLGQTMCHPQSTRKHYQQISPNGKINRCKDHIQANN